jgi:hypothetical protein
MDTEQQFDDEFSMPQKTINDLKREIEESSVHDITTDIVNRYKAEVRAKYGNRKRHRQ